jgi:hypothetical protein
MSYTIIVITPSRFLNRHHDDERSCPIWTPDGGESWQNFVLAGPALA